MSDRQYSSGAASRRKTIPELDSLWITGPVRSGKTTCLVEQFQDWVQTGLGSQPLPRQSTHLRSPQITAHSVLILAASSRNRTSLVQQLLGSGLEVGALSATTPLGFFESELRLFWPLLVETLHLEAHLPLRLRPETEQVLAAQVWQPWLESGQITLDGASGDRLVRQLLDLLQVAALSGTAIAAIPARLEAGLANFSTPFSTETPVETLAGALGQWRDWCLARGFLTYGILSELYGQHLLPHPIYRQHLTQRYRGVLADDVDNYPAIARSLFEVLLDHGAIGAFTFNPQGSVRRGLGADPDCLGELRHRAQVIDLSAPAVDCLGRTLGLEVLDVLERPRGDLPDALQSIQAGSRSQLLRQTAAAIVAAVQSGQVQPQEIAVIGPGIDAIARYSLTNILGNAGIAVQTLRNQQPLNSFPLTRALLTLLALVYPGCGRLIDRDQVAELLVVLTQSRIDPVRAGLLADHCFGPHPDHPQLLPMTDFSRWDRLGYEAATAYEALRTWLDQQQNSLEQLQPAIILDRGIQQFLWPQGLSADQLATLRALMETAQHYWQVTACLQSASPSQPPQPVSHHVGEFVQLLRRGTITANPLLPNPGLGINPAVTLATTFQYRMARLSHRWHFWLDVSSPLWQDGGAVVLWGAPLFLSNPAPLSNPEPLQRLLLDLLNRVEERVYLCHSDLAVSGQEQVGPLLPLVDAATPFLLTTPASFEG